MTFAVPAESYYYYYYKICIPHKFKHARVGGAGTLVASHAGVRPSVKCPVADCCAQEWHHVGGKEIARCTVESIAGYVLAG